MKTDASNSGGNTEGHANQNSAGRNVVNQHDVDDLGSPVLLVALPEQAETLGLFQNCHVRPPGEDVDTATLAGNERKQDRFAWAISKSTRRAIWNFAPDVCRSTRILYRRFR